MRPGLIPYGFLSERMPQENQSLAGVGLTRERIESTIAWAAEAAEDLPRAAITSAPRVWTVLKKVS
jgi:hypothetical protein